MTSKNQVTIPVDALRKAGIAEDDVVAVYAEGDGRIVVERVESLVERYARQLEGVWPGGVEQFLAERRQSWE